MTATISYSPSGTSFVSDKDHPDHVSFVVTTIMEGSTMPDPDDRSQQVDALLNGLPEVLPPPPVCVKLRLAAGLTQQDVADAVGVKRVAVTRWELGQTSPRRPHRENYLRLLKGLAARFPEAAKADEGMPTPASEGGSG
ncbi:helix-turn-helix transcriptional regulator [Streptomyces sp. NBC_00122]|uniref:helix-turn-helix transcriptional regulator n=1 Tax=Streptomyces sp. NBC_00122 TaxID=2903623 RepID=UPI002F907425